MTPPLLPVPSIPDSLLGTRQAMSLVAGSQNGYREGYNNDTAFGVWYPMNHVAWCGEFISWAAARAGIPTSVIPKYAYTPAGKAWFDARAQTHTVGEPGDIGFVYFDSLGRIGHTFYVDSVSTSEQGIRLYHTVEGNTNDTGSSQGIGVFRLMRAQTGRLYFGRPKYVTPPPPPPADWFDMASKEDLIAVVRAENATLYTRLAGFVRDILPRGLAAAFTGRSNMGYNRNVTDTITQKPYSDVDPFGTRTWNASGAFVTRAVVEAIYGRPTARVQQAGETAQYVVFGGQRRMWIPAADVVTEWADGLPLTTDPGKVGELMALPLVGPYPPA